MSVRWPGSMSGSRVKSPLLLLFLLLLNAGTVLCQDGEDGDDTSTGEEDISAGDRADEDTPTSDPLPDDPETTLAMDPPPINEEIIVDDTPLDEAELGSGDIKESTEEGMNPTIPSEVDSLSPILIILIPVGLVVIITAIIAGIFIYRRGNAKAKNRGLKEEDPYLDGSAAEKVPMPMFEEDVPSVLELEMEELDQWMQQDGETAKESMQA